MITLPPYLNDSEVYPMLPGEHRWVMNKLTLSEELGYTCGPAGTDAPDGDFCVRPMMNTYGNADGGFYKYTVGDQTPIGRRIPNHPGYFWCQWFEGDFTFTEFINDVPMWTQVGVISPSGRSTFSVSTAHLTLPPILQGISRYMLLEAIDGSIIEASCRLMANSAHTEAVDDYRTVDPAYNPTNIVEGLIDGQRRNARPYIQRGFYWDELDNTRRPW